VQALRTARRAGFRDRRRARDSRAGI